AALRRAGLTPTVIQVLAREESEPTLEGPFDLVDCETGAVLTTAINGEALRAYGERFAAWTVELQAACAAQRAGFIRVFTDQRIDEGCSVICVEEWCGDQLCPALRPVWASSPPYPRHLLYVARTAYPAGGIQHLALGGGDGPIQSQAHPPTAPPRSVAAPAVTGRPAARVLS